MRRGGVWSCEVIRGDSLVFRGRGKGKGRGEGKGGLKRLKINRRH